MPIARRVSEIQLLIEELLARYARSEIGSSDEPVDSLTCVIYDYGQLVTW